MNREDGFTHAKWKTASAFLLSFVMAFMFFPCQTVWAADSQAARIIGSWKVYKDDDRPNGKVPEEIMSFWPGGKLLITGDHPNEGLYRINGDKLELLIKKGDRAIPVEMHFKLQDKELKFKNQKEGWVYYKRISNAPQGKEPKL